jgi:hypothetical protein
VAAVLPARDLGGGAELRITPGAKTSQVTPVGLILTTDSFTNSRQQLIADLTNRHRLPAISAREARETGSMTRKDRFA